MNPAIFAKIIANNPASILLTLGGIGWLAGISGAGVLLFCGFLLQVGWLIPRFF